MRSLSYTQVPKPISRNAQLIEMRTKLLHAAAVAYTKDPTNSLLEELNRVVRMSANVINDEVSEKSGEKWKKLL